MRADWSTLIEPEVMVCLFNKWNTFLLFSNLGYKGMSKGADLHTGT